MELNQIILNGREYYLVDKETLDYLNRIIEPYLPYPSINKADISSQNISESVSNGFSIKDYDYFYFTSTDKDRVLYTKAGNMVLQNMVFQTSYLSNVVEDIKDDEVITIHYGN